MAARLRLRSFSLPRRLARLLVGLLALAAGVVGITPGPAQAAVDPCLTGGWTHSGIVMNSLNGEAMTGTVDITFPSAASGAASLFVNIETELHYRHYFGTEAEPYTVTAASTPSSPAGALLWSDPLPISIIPTELPSGAYSCTEGELSISVPLAFGPLTFTRDGPGPVPTTVRVVPQGTGHGTVVSNPGPINCPPTCSGSWWPDTPVTLVAGTAGGFMGWGGGACTPSAFSCVVVGDGEVTATFGQALYVAVTGAGTVTGATTTPTLFGDFGLPTIDCPGNCFAYFPQAATLQATPAPGYQLDPYGGWTWPCVRPLPETCQLAMTQPSQVAAIFTAIPTDVSLPRLQGQLKRSFQGTHYQQTTMRPGTRLWRGENERVPGVSGSHFGNAYFGLEQPTTSAQAERLYNIAIWKNNAQCLQEYEVTEAWRAYIGRVAGGTGTQVLAGRGGGGRATVLNGPPLTIPQLLGKKWIRTVGLCIPLPVA